MTKIKTVRPILLSAPYADADINAEVQLHLPSGYRTCGLVALTLEDGTQGLGEGYLAVFAPQVFAETIKLLTPLLVGREAEDYPAIMADLVTATGYWSLQGAARHVLSALEIALIDCAARLQQVPVYELLGGKAKSIAMYGSGGDSVDAVAMEAELQSLQQRGIRYFKIRARPAQLEKAVWTIRRAEAYGIRIAIDLTQNLANPGLSVEEVLAFEAQLLARSGTLPFFLEEALGMAHAHQYPELKKRAQSRIAGGEIVTTEAELIARVRQQYYHIAQPDATVVGGIRPVIDIFAAAQAQQVETVVHCWGGPVGMMANYHAAVAGKAELVEWPMPAFPLREVMVEEPWQIASGMLTLPTLLGLGVKLTPEVERQYPFRPEAVYQCLPTNHYQYDAALWKI